MKNNLERYIASHKKLKKAQNKLLLARASRVWVQKTIHIHALNYLYYRYFTNEFELFILTHRITSRS